MKANDKGVPEDEMLLAEAIAAAKSRGLGWCSGASFQTRSGKSVHSTEQAAGSDVVAVCAVGALHFAGRWDATTMISSNLALTCYGNDRPDTWTNQSPPDRGESLGWAFRCAMTQDEESP